MSDFRLEPLDLKDESMIDFLFNVRSHPLVCKNLFGNPPLDLQAHKSWLDKNVPQKRLIYLFYFKDIPIGYCQAYDFGSLSFEAGFVIHPDYQGKGYGRSMVEYFMKTMAQRYVGWKVILKVRDTNNIALSLYEKCGFGITGKKDGTVCMEKLLLNIKKIAFVCSGHDAMLKRWALNYLSEAVKKNGIDTCVIDLATTTDENCVMDADVVLVYRSFDLKALRFMRRVKYERKFLMFFLDDYLFQKDCKYTGDWEMPMEPFEISDCLVSSSSFLLSKMPDKPKILRRSVLDYDAMWVLNQEYRRNNDVFGIGWTGSAGRKNMKAKFVYETLRLLNAYMPSGHRCVFHTFGNLGYPQFPNIDIKEYNYFPPDQWKELYRKFVSFDLGVVINPLDEDDEFCHAKSELKLVESGAMGVPLITSRVTPYLDIINEGENGMFASTPKEYCDKIIKLMTDEKLSRDISKNVKKMIREKYDVFDNAKQFIRDLNMVVGNKQTLYPGFSDVVVKNF